jgi:4-amino-4-deoxychorismate lyase
MKISIDGKLCDEKDAYISAYDHGFLYGMGLFETFRTYQGKPFLLHEHLIRLKESCRQIGISWHVNEHEVEQWVEQLLLVNQLPDAYFRLSITAGVEPLGLPSSEYRHPTLILYVKPLSDDQLQQVTITKNLQLLKHRRNSPESMTRLKSFHYMNNIVAKFELQQYSWAKDAEGLMLTEQSQLAEGIVSNIFFVKNHMLFTPSLDTGILAGITRAQVIRIARNLSWDVQESLYTWEHLLDAEEVFVTNSIQGIVPVTLMFNEFGEQFPVAQQSIGSYTFMLIDRYRQLTERVTRS